MFVSEITLVAVKKYMHVDYDDEDDLIEAFLQASKEYVKTYTGLSTEEVETKESLTPVVFILCADMYDNRFASNASSRVSSKINVVLESILGMHSVNLI